MSKLSSSQEDFQKLSRRGTSAVEKHNSIGKKRIDFKRGGGCGRSR